MPKGGEIVTLQLGNYSNHIGAHWWNIQESSFCYDPLAKNNEVDHDVLYREGLNLERQITFTPRLLLVDLHGSLKHLATGGELYGHGVKRANCSETANIVETLKADLEGEGTNVEVKNEPEIAKNTFQTDLENNSVNFEENQYNLVDSVQTWTDFNYARYHHRTMHVVKQYQFVADKQTFDTFSCGSQVWRTPQFQEEFSDKVRQYVEECDYLQGFQMIFDAFNGFSGMATQCLNDINSEYGKATLAFPVFLPKNIPFEGADESTSDSIRVINSVLAFSELAEQSSLFVPLCTRTGIWRQLGASVRLPSLNFDAESLYQTSAVLASYIDTATLRYRVKEASFSSTLGALCKELTNRGRKMAAAAISLPFTMHEDEDLIDCLDKLDVEPFTLLTPNCTVGTDYVVQSLCSRGIAPERLKRPLEQAQRQMQMAAYKCSNVSQMLQLYCDCKYHASMAHVTSVISGMRTRLPFPCEMFAETCNRNGFLSSNKRSPLTNVHSVPALASVQSSKELKGALDTLCAAEKRIKLSKLHRFSVAGLENDDYVALVESLQQFRGNYTDNLEL